MDAASSVYAVGMAPDAQLFIMKVFGAAGGAYDSDYMVAIEDAITLGCDAVNLSLGSPNPGFSYSGEYQSILNKLADSAANSKLVVSISAGNAGGLTDHLSTDLYIDDVSMHTGGSPGTFANSLCVASADNLGVTGCPLTFNGDQTVFYTETSSTGARMSTIAGSYDYVYIDAVGNAADYSTVNAALSLSGKVVLVNRGSISFVDKGNNAKSYNPAALIVANHESGTVNMGLDGYTGSFPMVSITLRDANTIKANSTAHTAGSVSYYTGTVAVAAETFSELVYTNPEISDFSSWGVPGSLTMKPEITAPGGDIYSIFGTNKTSGGTTEGGSDQYELMSGTSMAAPHVAGLVGTFAQYLRENNISVSGHNVRQLVQSRLMSTAIPMHIGAEDGPYYPILQQGAGLVNVRQAVHASSAIFMESDATASWADGKVKAELGDKLSRSGSYSYSFTIHNMAAQAQTYTLSTDLFTQDRYEEDGCAFMSASTTPLNWNVSYSTGSSVTVPAGGTKKVTVTIAIPADMSAFDALYPSGAYVEGYTFVESRTLTGDGAKLDVRHSIPILGFYGSWTDPSMFDNMSYVDQLYGADRVPYSGVSDTNYMTYTSKGSNKKFSGNPYLTEDSFPADRLAMNSADAVYSFTYNLLRSAGATGVAISKLNAAGKVSAVLDAKISGTEVDGLWYYSSQSTWMGTAAKTELVNKTLSSYGLSAGDRFRVGFYAIPEYNAMQVNQDITSSSAGKLTAGSFKRLLLKNVLGRGAMVGYDFTVDDQAPEITGAYRQGNQVIVTVRDDHYIACLGLTNSTGSTFYAKTLPAQSAEGEVVVYTFDVASAPADCYVFAGDYADNQSLVKPTQLAHSVSAVSSNASFGTVSVVGYTVIASPAVGYYVSGAELISGTASWVIDGNVISVTPSSDCTLRVIFSPRPVVTVHFVANGTEEGSQSCYQGDPITLPGSVSNSVTGYSFSGWMDTTLPETTDTPSYFAPGALYTVPGDVTLYALYTRHEGPEGLTYELCTELPASLPGSYVITSSANSSGYMMMNYNGGYNYNYDAAVLISSSGANLTGTTLSSVPQEMVFTVQKSVNDPAKYNILPNTINGVYLADMSYGLGVNTYDNDSTQWSFSFTNGKFSISSDSHDNLALGLITSYFSSDVYFGTDRNLGGVNLWLEQPAGVDYFTTYPVADDHTHVLVHQEAVAPTCGENGNIEYWQCSLCGKCFSDAAGQNEISQDSTVVPATGNHSFGSTCSSNNNGTHSYTCTVCGAVETEDCTYEDVVTPPTPTSQGYTTHTCTHCGYSYVDSFVPALGSVFTVTFSVLGDTTVIAPMESNTNTGITLPTAQGPEGYSFLGWVTENYDNVTDQPAGILTGTYVAQGNIVLYALFSRVDGSTGQKAFALINEAPTDWTGRWVITYGKNSSLYALTGIPAGSYESGSAGATAFASTGMELNNDVLTNVSNLYVFEVQPKNQNYAIRNAEKTTYLQNKTFTLMASAAYDAATCDWTFIPDQIGNIAIKNVNATSYPYIGFNYSNRYFMATGSIETSLRLWQEIDVGTVYYTTVEAGGSAHTHTVQYHGEEPATCTENGVKAYYYCSAADCPLAGMKFEDAALTVEITDVTIPAQGHDWKNPTYAWSNDNSEVIASRVCRRDSSHVETETAQTTCEVTVEATVEHDGEMVYTAVFENQAFTTQTKTVIIPRIGETPLPCDGGEGCPGRIFEDMPSKSHWSHDAIDWVLVKGISAGTSGTTFSPDQLCTRAQAVTFLWRMANCPEPANMNNPFTDVPSGSYYEKAVLWAVEMQITAGTGAGRFSPNASCTRAQIVTFLWKLAGSPAPSLEDHPFTDVLPGAYYESAVLWALERGITVGTSANHFSPDVICSRAQIVTFLYRYKTN